MSMFYVDKLKRINVARGLTFALSKTLETKTPVNAVAASGVITISDTPVADETLLIGDNLFTFKAARSGLGEITINANTTTQADNIVAAVTADSTDVTATNNANVITVVAATKGVVGNTRSLFSTATGVTVSSVTDMKLDGGVDGTVGAENEVVKDSTYLYVSDGANTIHDANWRRIALGSVY